MGLVRMAARTAVVAGTATAVSGRVARRQAAKYDQPEEEAAARSRSRGRRRTGAGRPDREAAGPRPAEQAGRPVRRGVRGREGQGPRHLSPGPSPRVGR